MNAPNFVTIAEGIGRLVSEKQRAYGDAFGRSGEVLRVLYPEGLRLDQLDDALTVVRVLDKLFRIATDRDALGESPWRDIAGYSLLAVERAERGRGTGSADALSLVVPEDPPVTFCRECASFARSAETSEEGRCGLRNVGVKAAEPACPLAVRR